MAMSTEALKGHVLREEKARVMFEIKVQLVKPLMPLVHAQVQ